MKKAILLCFIIFSFKSFSQSISVNYAGSLQYGRTQHESQLLHNGKVLVFGGDNNNYPGYLLHRTAELYNPNTKTWTSTGSMSENRRAFASVVLNDGNVLAIGGVGESQDAKMSCEVYNVNTGIWSYTGYMKEPRRSHKAIKLLNGNVLVAGGASRTKSCELYNSFTSKWAYTGSMNIARGEGISLVMLNDGKVLVTGGATTEAKITSEIYDPVTGKWSMISNKLKSKRNLHNSVKLKDGRILISGTNEGSYSEQLKTEIYDPSTNLFTQSSNLLEITNASPMILLEDGSALLYSTGDVFSPTNTKCIQIYNPNTNIWESGSYSFLGTTDYTIHRLFDGDILIIGGSGPIGTAASQTCLLIKQSGFSGCISPNLSLKVSGSSVCSGKSAFISVENTQADVTYTAYNAGAIVSNSVTGGGQINLAVLEDKLIAGNNIINVEAKKSGCKSYFLSDTASIKVKEADLPAPVIYAAGQTIFCEGDSILLTAPSGPYGYKWSNGATTSSIQARKEAVYKVWLVNTDGCLSPESNHIEVSWNGNLIAGPNQTVCESASPFQLTGFQPVGGTWSGKGVTSGGIFNPALAGAGAQILTYTFCTKSITKTITVNYSPKPRDFIIEFFQDTICEDNGTELNVLNSELGMNYELRMGNTRIGYYQTGNGRTLSFYIPDVTKTTTYNIRTFQYYGVCDYISIVKEKTLVVLPKPKSVNIYAVEDSLCWTEAPKFKIESEKGVQYRYHSNSDIGAEVEGTGGLIEIDGIPSTGSKGYSIQARNSLCDWRNLKTIDIIGYSPTVRFTSSSLGYYLGEDIGLTNLSSSKENNWTFDNTASISTSNLKEPSVSYKITGSKTIRLESGLAALSCTRTASKTIGIFAQSGASSGEVCSFDSLTSKDYPVKVLDFHKDIHGNSYIAGVSVLPHNSGDYNVSLNMYLKKINPDGKILWEISQSPLNYYRPYDYYSTIITGITTDPSENIYITGSYSSKEFKIDSIEVKHEDNYAEFFILKLNAAGVAQWIIHSDNSSDDPMGGTDIVYKNDNQIFVSLIRPGLAKFPDGSTKNLEDEIVILEIDKNGKYKKSFSAGKISYDYHSRCLYTFGSSYDPRKTATVSPKIELDKNGKLFVIGKFYDRIDFGKFSVSNYYGNYNGYVAILDTLKGWEKAFVTYGKTMGSALDYISTGDDAFPAYAMDDNHIYITETNADTIKLNNGEKSVKKDGSLIAKYTKEGNLVWYNHNNNSTTKSLVLSKEKNELFMFGDYHGFYGVSSQNNLQTGVKSKGNRDLFLSSISLDGNMNWVETLGSINDDKADFMIGDLCDNLYFSGTTYSPISFKAKTININAKTWKTFFSKFSPYQKCNSLECVAKLPSIVSFAPSSGEWGSKITVHGKNLTGASLADLNKIPGAITPVNDSTAVVVVPQNATSGKVRITTSGGTAMSTNDFVVLPSLPVINNLMPAYGSIGISITISGANFSGITNVKFNGISTTYSVNNSGTLTATVPVGATTGKIAVTNVHGTTVSVNDFTITPPPPIFNSFNPTSGGTGTKITISGANFSTANAVKLNGVTAVYTITNDSQIEAIVPAGASTGKISITNPGGTMSTYGDFTITLPAPTITGFSPVNGATGTSVTISGANFTNTTSIKFNGIAANYTITNSNQIIAIVPTGTSTGKISVITTHGSGISTDNFIINIPAPNIAGFSPSSGPSGTSVTISGANFTGITSVKFAGISANYSVINSNQITTTVPAGATTGKITITATGGVVTSNADFTVTLPPPASISGFSPASGVIGTYVIIQGTNLNGVTYVSFNGVKTTYTIASSSMIVAIVPQGATTGKIFLLSKDTVKSVKDFIVLPPAPVISSFTPTSGVAATKVKISGANFTGATSVTFNGLASVFSVINSGQIEATVPAGALSGKISVIHSGGTTTSTGYFTVIKFLPSISSLKPLTGLIGTQVTITGNNFTAVSSVKFNGISATYNVTNSNQIIATVPSGMATGKIAITTNTGVTTSLESFTITQTINQPTGVTVESIPGTIILEWIDNSDNEKKFIIERSKNKDSGFVTIDSVNANITEYADTTITDTTTYYYRVYAINTESVSKYSSLAVASLSTVTASDNDEIERSITIAPNPSSGIFRVKIGDGRVKGTGISLSVSDIIGNSVHPPANIDNTSGSLEILIDLTMHPNGVYLLEIKSFKGRTVKRLIKK